MFSLEFHPVTIREITTTDPVYPQVFALRDAVLRRPLGLSLHDEDTRADAADRIVIAENENGGVIGCVMLKALPRAVFKLRQMAVAPECQGTGVGRRVVQAAEEIAWREGGIRIEMHARLAVLPFYQKLGYTVEGDVFTEVGIPHYFMKKDRPV